MLPPEFDGLLQRLREGKADATDQMIVLALITALAMQVAEKSQ
jgi:hypothetical protein